MHQAHADIATYVFGYLFLRSVKGVDVFLQSHFLHVELFRDVQLLKEELELLGDFLSTYI